MKILLVADGRSPITRRWVQTLHALDMDVALVSTFPCPPVSDVDDLTVLPVAFGALSGSQAGGAKTSGRRVRRLVGGLRNVLLGGRYLLGPFSVGLYARRYQSVLKRVKPDLVHALRIPYEGMLARHTLSGIPLIVSIWGNDLTLHARGSNAMAGATRQVLQRADGLMADTCRDLRLAFMWGFDPDKPTLNVPGAGGVDLVELNRRYIGEDPFMEDLPQDVPWVINPRGFRPGSVRNDVFFAAARKVVAVKPEVCFLCPAMAGQSEAQAWVKQHGLEQHVRLLPYLPQQRLWELFQRSTVSVSVSEHDGTPNSLLEAMGCGCLPVCGDIESIREWIVPGVNGLLVPPADADLLAQAILAALDNPLLRDNAAAYNQRMLAERAEVGVIRQRVRGFYEAIIQHTCLHGCQDG